MRTVAIIQARLASTRLPRKALLPILGRPLIAHVVERAQKIRGVDEIVVACPGEDMRALAEACGCWAYGYSGREDDVLGRFVFAADQTKADRIVRITGDCPLLLPEACEAAIAAHQGGDWGSDGVAASEHDDSGWPDGTGGEVLSRDALVRVNRREPANGARQHFTRLFPRLVVPNPHPERLSAPLSVNTVDDLDRVLRIYEHLAPGDTSWHGLLAAVEAAGV